MCIVTEKPTEPKKKAKLILENGETFSGFSFGSPTSVGGEVGKLKLRLLNRNSRSKI